MIKTLLAAALFLSAPAFAQDQPAAPAPDAKPEPPKLVCTWEPVTGTRAKKQKVCKTPGYERGAERSKDMFRNIITGSGNITPPTPGGGG